MFEILKKEQVQCMFSGCCGIITKDNAKAHSLTHIAKLADIRASKGVNKRDQKQWEKGSVANSNRTNNSNRSVKKEDVVINELEWTKLKE
jgi:hypothetical protein